MAASAPAQNGKSKGKSQPQGEKPQQEAADKAKSSAGAKAVASADQSALAREAKENADAVELSGPEIVSNKPADDGESLWRKKWKLAQYGIAFEAANLNDVLSNMQGGLQRHTAVIGNLTLSFSIDAEKLLGWRHTTAAISGWMNYGGHIADFVGDVQGVSNIEGPQTVLLYEAWLEREFPKSAFSVRAGLYDLNSEFYVLESAGLFLNGAQGMGVDFGQTGENGPSVYPYTAIGVRLQWWPLPQVALRMALSDAVPGHPDHPFSNYIGWSRHEGVLLTTELGLQHGDFEEAMARYGKLALGAWIYTSRFHPVTTENSPLGVEGQGNFGVYFLAEKTLRANELAANRGLVAFLRFGLANGFYNQFDMGFGSGLVYRGLFDAQAEDQAGIGITLAHASDRFGHVEAEKGRHVHNSELALEATYQRMVASWLMLQPDVQYIIHPGLDPDTRNALVIGLRIGVTR